MVFIPFKFKKRFLLAKGKLIDPTSKESAEAWQEASREKEERGEKAAANVRYGETISEHGFGGDTVRNSGSAEQGVGFGGTEDEGREGGQTRREQGYGGGNDVGA